MGVSDRNDHVSMSFEDALEKTGNGLYNYLLAATCSLILLGICIDLFGFGLIVTAACDLQITVVQKGILTSLPFGGIIVSSYMWGYISDTAGRKYTLMISMITAYILSSLSSLSPNWVVLGVLKFLDVCFSCAANSIAYTLMGESCVQRVRSKYMLVMTCFLIWGSGAAVVLTYPTLKLDLAAEIPLLGLVFKPWRLLIIVHALPTGLAAVACYFFHESPKFLFNQGRVDDALAVMKSMYALNHHCSKEDFKVHSLIVPDTTTKKKRNFLNSLYEQSAPLFRPPLLVKTVQLYYITFVVYITNNSFLVFFPVLLNLMRTSANGSGNVCTLLRASEETEHSLSNNNSSMSSLESVPDICDGTVKDYTLVTILVSQTIYASLNFIIAWFPNQRKSLMIFIICLSACSGILTNLMPEPISSTVFFVMFPCTCLTMGILASYFVDMYPTSYRGMASCLSIMVGRTSGFIGINIVANFLFTHCEITLYVWSVLVISSAIASWFLPADKRVATKTETGT